VPLYISPVQTFKISQRSDTLAMGSAGPRFVFKHMQEPQHVLTCVAQWHWQASRICINYRHAPMQCITRNILFRPQPLRLQSLGMAQTGARLSKMTTNHICIATTSQYPNLLQTWNTCQEKSGHLAGPSYLYRIWRQRERHIIR
jgi:hypothetical protein